MVKLNQTRILSRTQLLTIALGVVAQLSFVATIKHYLMTGNWGYPRVGWLMPKQMISIAGFHTNSDSLVNYHLISSYLLYVSLLTQFGLMLFLKRTKVLVRIHRGLGTLVILVLLPAFVILSLGMAYFFIHNLINQLLFAIIPMTIAFGLLKGVLAARNELKNKHIDGMFLALALMNTASVFRLLIGLLFLMGVPVESLFSNGEPSHLAALCRTMLMIIILVISFNSTGRLAENKVPIYALGLTSLLGMIIHFWTIFV